MSAKTSKLWEMAPHELEKQLHDAQEELMNLRFQQATGELTDHTRLRQTRRQIARLQTILRQRELGAGVGGSK
jgi:large subunit ribosomal protein L29